MDTTEHNQLPDSDKGREANKKQYDEYYAKPSWWFKLRYPTQIKRKTVGFLIKRAGILPTKLKVLEIGFGSGDVLLSFPTDCEICGIELSRSAISRAEKRAESKGFSTYSFVTEDVGFTSFEENYFDLIIASHVLEHVSDDVALLSTIYRMLKIGGAAIFLVPINEKFEDPNHVRHYSPHSLKMQIANVGSGRILSEIENDFLFRLVEAFYYKNYNKRWGLLGTIASVGINLPIANLPFSFYQRIDQVMGSLGYLSRQYGCVFQKQGTG
jgi:ubiquinone/menaquinone biosynthesis C-methylase UbiE